MRRLTTLLVLVASAALLTACSGGGPEEPGVVSMPEGHRFAPETLEVVAGDQIRFENDGSESHTITAYEDSLPEAASYFASGGATSEEEARENVGDGLVGQGDEFSMTIDTPGTYKYFCIPHEQHGMTGTIIVTAAEN